MRNEIAGFFGKVDEAIQRQVDRGAHFLMRTLSVRKAFLQYACGALMACSSGAMAYLTKSYFFLAFAMIYLVRTYFNEHRRKEDENGIIYKADEARVRWLGALKILATWFFIVDIALALSTPSAATLRSTALADIRAVTFAVLAFDFTFFIDLYLTKTPKTPPPQEVRLPALVPVPVRSK